MSYSRSQRFGGHKRKKKGKALLKIALLLLLIGFVFYTYRTVGLITALQGNRDGYFEKSLDGRQNYMISYVDEQIRTTFIISMDETGPAYYINIPTNTRVDSNKEKILLSDLYKEYGKEGLLVAVDELFNDYLPINGYIVLEKQGLENLVNTLEGINLDIKKDSEFITDSLILLEGERKILKDSAITYFSYVEPNHTEGYMERQVNTLRTVFDDYFKWSRTFNLLSGLSKIDGYFDTNMSIRQLAWFRNMLDETSGREKFITTIPGTTEQIDDRNFWIVDNSKVSSVTQNINTNNSLIFKEDISTSVLNGNGIAGIAGRLGERIAALGYENIVTDNANSTDYSRTIVKYSQGLRHLAEEILDEISIDGVLEEIGEANTIIVILGKDIN